MKSDRAPALPRIEMILERILPVWLIGCVVAFVAVSLRWPMVGDVTYLHYVVFLMHHGMAPYRDIVDMNLPGAYLLEGAVMATLGAGSIGWRIYDLLLLAIASASFLSILRPYGRIAGIFASALFIMVHAQDGEIMSGERDFAVSVFLLAAVALLFLWFRRPQASYSLVFGSSILLGIAANVKPTVIPLVICLLIWTGWTLHRRQPSARPFVATAFAGILIPFAATLIFLVKLRAFVAFLNALHELIPYHASLAHKSLGFLLGHCASPLIPLFLLWAITSAILRSQKSELDFERPAILICAVFGLCSYVLQQKGFAYQRYPFLAFLIILFARDFIGIARTRTTLRLVGVTGLVAGAVFCTLFLARITKFDQGKPARPILTDLQALRIGPREIQCMDTAGSCIDDLYAGQIIQSTGFLYDCYLLDGTNNVALDLRRRFWQQIEQNPPRAIVVTDSVCYDPVPSFDKFTRWPKFSDYLAANYELSRQSGPQKPVHYWNRSITPFAYRIYIRRLH